MFEMIREPQVVMVQEGDQVRVEYFSGPFGGAATKLGEQVVYLGPGATYDLNPTFTILAGDAVYAVQLTPLGGQEVVTASG